MATLDRSLVPAADRVPCTGYIGYPFENRAGNSNVSYSLAICPMESWSRKESGSVIGDAYVGTEILSSQHNGSKWRRPLTGVATRNSSLSRRTAACSGWRKRANRRDQQKEVEGKIPHEAFKVESESPTN